MPFFFFLIAFIIFFKLSSAQLMEKRPLYFLYWISGVHPHAVDPIPVFCVDVSSVGLLASRKDLSRNHQLCGKTHLNNQLPPRSHNAENESFGLPFTRHQRCQAEQRGLRKGEVRVHEKKAPSRAEETEMSRKGNMQEWENSRVLPVLV